MRRLYVLPKGLHDTQLQLYPAGITTHWLALVPSGDTAALDLWKTAGSPVLVSTQFDREDSQDLFESHPLVTVMPHPAWHAGYKIAMTPNMPENANSVPWGQTTMQNASLLARFATLPLSVAPASWGSSLEGENEANKHGFDHLLSAVVGVTADDTILQVHTKIALVAPAFRFKGFR